MLGAVRLQAWLTGAFPLLDVLLLCVGVESAMAFELQSPAFSPSGEIPAKYTCDGADLSPPLRWSDPPPKTKSFALIADDPDAPVGTWVHWVVYRMPAALRELAEGLPARDVLGRDARVKRLQEGRLRRPVSTAWTSPPLLLQALRPGHRTYSAGA